MKGMKALDGKFYTHIEFATRPMSATPCRHPAVYTAARLHPTGTCKLSLPGDYDAAAQVASKCGRSGNEAMREM
jgi:hypothetical protein